MNRDAVTGAVLLAELVMQVPVEAGHLLDAGRDVILAAVAVGARRGSGSNYPDAALEDYGTAGAPVAAGAPALGSWPGQRHRMR